MGNSDRAVLSFLEGVLYINSTVVGVNVFHSNGVTTLDTKVLGASRFVRTKESCALCVCVSKAETRKGKWESGNHIPPRAATLFGVVQACRQGRCCRDDTELQQTVQTNRPGWLLSTRTNKAWHLKRMSAAQAADSGDPSHQGQQLKIEHDALVCLTSPIFCAGKQVKPPNHFLSATPWEPFRT